MVSAAQSFHNLNNISGSDRIGDDPRCGQPDPTFLFEVKGIKKWEEVKKQ